MSLRHRGSQGPPRSRGPAMPAAAAANVEPAAAAGPRPGDDIPDAELTELLQDYTNTMHALYSLIQHRPEFHAAVMRKFSYYPLNNIFGIAIQDSFVRDFMLGTNYNGKKVRYTDKYTITKNGRESIQNGTLTLNDLSSILDVFLDARNRFINLQREKENPTPTPSYIPIDQVVPQENVVIPPRARGFFGSIANGIGSCFGAFCARRRRHGGTRKQRRNLRKRTRKSRPVN
jgi:hypothetical protein